jgi:hypothetical protein
MYDLQISDDVAAFLTGEGVCRLALSANSRSLRCSVCSAPLGGPDPRVSVVVIRDRRARASAIRLAHAWCAPTELREAGLRHATSAVRPPGHDWNLLRFPTAPAPAVLAWETHPPFQRPAQRVDSGGAYGDPLAAALRRSGFARATAALSEAEARTSCRLTLHSAGRHLVLARDGRRWLEFSDAAGSDGAQPWLEEAHRVGCALLLFGPGLGGEALGAGDLAAALDSGLVLCATARIAQPRAAGRRHGGRSREAVEAGRAGIVARRTGRRGLT